MTWTLNRRTALSGSLAVAFAGAAAPIAGAAGRRPHDGRVHGWVTSTMARMTLREKIGQLFVQQVYGSDATTPDARNLPLYGVERPADVVRKYGLGGVIYFAWTDSVKNPEQIAGLSNGLQEAALGRDSKVRVPLTLSVDQEQGIVTRIGPPATQFPGSMALGAGRSAEDARTAAAITGLELRAMGLTTDFAPVADVNVNPLNPVIGTRSFSSDPALAAEMVAAQVHGYQDDGGVMASAKHFPGHGAGGDALRAVDSGGVAELDRLGDVVGGQSDGLAELVVDHAQGAVGVDLLDVPAVAVLDPVGAADA